MSVLSGVCAGTRRFSQHWGNDGTGQFTGRGSNSSTWSSLVTFCFVCPRACVHRPVGLRTSDAAAVAHGRGQRQPIRGPQAPCRWDRFSVPFLDRQAAQKQGPGTDTPLWGITSRSLNWYRQAVPFRDRIVVTKRGSCATGDNMGWTSLALSGRSRPGRRVSI